MRWGPQLTGPLAGPSRCLGRGRQSATVAGSPKQYKISLILVELRVEIQFRNIQTYILRISTTFYHVICTALLGTRKTQRYTATMELLETHHLLIHWN